MDGCRPSITCRNFGGEENENATKIENCIRDETSLKYKYFGIVAIQRRNQNGNFSNL
jgi:hypothetical protein